MSSHAPGVLDRSAPGAAVVQLPWMRMLCCPSCRGALSEDLRCMGCGIEFRLTDGIPDLLLPTERSEVEAFLTEYNAIRRAQGWEVTDIEKLPYEGGAPAAYWRFRRRSFEIIRERCAAPPGGGSVALDIGAGFAWLTRWLAGWGYEAIAIDVNIAPPLGLSGGDEYIRAGSAFNRVRAGIDRLPFGDATADLVVLNASLTYAKDPAGVIRRVQEILRPGGRVIIADTPIYGTLKGGESMSRRLYRHHRRALGRAPIYHERFTYLLKQSLFRYLEDAGFEFKVMEPAPDLWWKFYVLRNRLALREPVWMPVIVARKSDGGRLR